jgi:hypothetical protein
LRISAADGHDPFWRKDGRELFYFANPGQMAVELKLGDAPQIGVPHLLFQPGAPQSPRTASTSCPSKAPASRPPPGSTLNWTAELAGK